MDSGAETSRGGEPERSSAGQEAALAALAVRVGELERQIREMSRAGAGAGRLGATMASPPPPPPLVAERLDGLAEKIEAVPADPKPGTSLESRLGSQVFSLVGILAVIVGTSWALKLAFERGLIGPVARVVIGLAAGVALVLWSESFRRKSLPAFSYTLKAVGTGVLYLALWAAFQLYHLLPAGVALGAMVLVTAWNAFMAWSQDAELLAGYALIGGFATPLLLATGGDHEGFLFVYLGAIDVATVLLLRWKRWQRLLLPAFGATVAFFVGWYARFFHAGRLTLWDGQSSETAVFAVVFWVVFGMVSARGWAAAAEATPGAGEVIMPVLIPLGNAAFVSLALYSVLQDSGMHGGLAWLMVGLAAVYLLLTRVQSTAAAGAMHLAMAVTFLTIAIPLKASGHALATAWLVEGLVLYWASGRVPGLAAKVLRGLSRAGFGLGLAALFFQWWSRDAGFINANLGTALVAAGTLAGAGWLAWRRGEPDAAGRDFGTLQQALVAIDLVALLLTAREMGDWRSSGRAAFANGDFGTALVGLAMLAGVAYACSRLRGVTRLLEIGGASLVIFNLVAVTSVVREIGALWTRTGSDVQRSLAISAFLMMYGAVLLAAGFWWRSPFVRWQGLILLVFTTLKVFLYDVSGLSQGYRVASFLGLGVLLLGVSFAYQKNWLALRDGGHEDGAR